MLHEAMASRLLSALGGHSRGDSPLRWTVCHSTQCFDTRGYPQRQGKPRRSDCRRLSLQRRACPLRLPVHPLADPLLLAPGLLSAAVCRWLTALLLPAARASPLPVAASAAVVAPLWPLGGAASVPLPLRCLPENRPGGLWLSLVLTAAAAAVSPVAAAGDPAAVLVVGAAAAADVAVVAAAAAALDDDDGDPAAVADAAVVVAAAVAAVSALPFLPPCLPVARKSLVFRTASDDLVLQAWGEVGRGGRVGEIPIPLGGGWTARGWRGRLQEWGACVHWHRFLFLGRWTARWRGQRGDRDNGARW